MSFTNFKLCDELLQAIQECGYTSTTPIQAKSIPAVLSGCDLLAMAQTGTGKTASFTLPILHMLATTNQVASRAGQLHQISALVLVPTRELALQVQESITLYGKYLKLTSMSIIGGVNINPQIKQLKNKIDILVATPGRLLDHVQQKNVNLSHIKFLVLDEADRMLDMGFIHSIKKILALLPKNRQSLMFSATFPDEIKTLADKFLRQPEIIKIAPSHTTAEMISHKVHLVDSGKKRALLTHLIQKHNWNQVLVFTRTKHGANKLVEYLIAHNIQALAIHGNKSQSARTTALSKFKDGTIPVLVATDIAARGIDIVDLPHVVNFELPNVPEDYVHRIGRTGRAGQSGDAVSLVSPDEQKLLVAIERILKKKIHQEIIPNFEPNPHAVSIALANSNSNGNKQINNPRQRKTSSNSSKRNNSKQHGRNDNKR